MLIMGWLSCDQSGGPIKQNRHPSHFVPGRQAKYTAVINITLILSDRALQRPVTSLAWVPRSTIGTLKGLSSSSSSSLLIFCSVMRLSHQLQVWHQWHFFFFCPPLHIKVGLLQHIKQGTTILGFSPLEWVWVKKCSDTGLQFHMGVFTLIVAEQMLQSLVMYMSTFLFSFFFAHHLDKWTHNHKSMTVDNCFGVLFLQLRNKWNKLIAAKNFVFFFSSLQYRR